MNNIVAIIGRPNVGKSTLFNRLIGQRQAIVDNISGVTRDRIYGTGEWNGKMFNVVDTGGFVKNTDDVFEVEIKKQVQIAMEEAAVILFMADVTTGITDLEQEIADMLRRKSDKTSILVVNKVDNNSRLLESAEFYALGFEHTFMISSISGSGTGELLDEMVKHLEDEPSTLPDNIPKFAIIGQPNVGKSSMLNLLIGQERNIVTDIPGTTRDSIHTYYNLFNKEFFLIDTAGIRKKAKVDEDLEFYSVIRAIKAIEESDVCILMIDAVMGIEAQDMKIFSVAVHRKKGIVLVANKWDLVEKETNTMKKKEEEYREKLAPFKDVPILFTSVKEKQRVFKVIETALEVYENKQRKVDHDELNQWMLDLVSQTPAPSYRGNFTRFKKVEQMKNSIPAFAFYCNYPDEIKEPYRNFLENNLRKKYNFTGVPVHIYFQKF